MNVFEAVKQSVTTRQAAEHFGIRVRRNGMCVCPFHADKNPSMKVDRCFHCFGCQADGDVIDFVSRLEAVSLSAPRKPPLCWRRCFPSPMRTRSRPATGSPGRKPRNSGSAAWSVTASGCCATIETCCAAGKRDYAPKTPDEDFHPLFVEALQKQDYVDYLLDVLLSPDMEERAALIIDCGKEVSNLRDYLNGLSWDGTERIRTCLHHFLGADSDQYTYESLRLFLLGAIHRAFHPGCKFEVMLCLVGGQGAGKSTFFRLLAVKDEWFSDDLRKLDDDNVYQAGIRAIILELKMGKSCEDAITQIKAKNYIQRVKDCREVLLVGINYTQRASRNSCPAGGSAASRRLRYDQDKHHECRIEKIVTKPRV